MTMTADFTPANVARPARDHEGRTAPGGRPAPHKVTTTAWGYVIEAGEVRDPGVPPLRAVAGAFGVAALFGAGALWIAPGALPDLEALPMTLASSAALLMMGVWLLTLGRERGALEAQVDHRRSEVRLVRRLRSGAARLLARHGFDVLTEIAVEGDEIVLTGRDGGRLTAGRLGA